MTHRHSIRFRWRDWSCWILRIEHRGRGIYLATYHDHTVDRTPTPRVWKRKRSHRWEDEKLRLIVMIHLGPLSAKWAIDDNSTLGEKRMPAG